MSATPRPSRPESINPDQPDYDSTAPSKVFRKAIIENPAICTRCFARQRTLSLQVVPVATVDANGDHLRMTQVDDADAGDEHVVMQASEATDTLELAYPPRVSAATASLEGVEVPVSWKRACPEPTLFCTECGAVDDDGDRATLSKHELLEHAKAVSRRLKEQDVRHDPGLLFAVTKMLKSKPVVQAKTEHILSHAVRASVEKRRYGRSRQMRVDDDANEIAVADASDVAWMTGH